MKLFRPLYERTLSWSAHPRAPLLLVKAAFGHLKRAEGSVLNIGSINGYSGESNQLAYSISKGALMTLTRPRNIVSSPPSDEPPIPVCSGSGRVR